MDDGAHQAQDAARALELLQGGPVAVEPVEQLGVDRVGGAQAPLVVGLEGLAGQLAPLEPVVIGEALDGGVALTDGVGVQVGEQAPSDDLEALPGRGRTPVVGDAGDDVLEALEGLAPALAADLELGGPGHGPVGADVGGGDGHEQERPGDPLDGGGELLGEGELGVEAPPDQVVAPVEAPRVGDPLVDEDEGGGVAGDEGPQGVAGVSAGAVRLGDERVGLGAPELPGELPPQGVDDGAVGLGGGLAGRDLVADDGDPVNAPGEGRAAEEVLDPLGELGQGRAAGQVPGGEHGVRLAAAERGLEVDDGLGVGVPGQAPGAHGQEGLESLGEVGALVEADGVHVLLGALAVGDLVEVGGEFGLPEIPGHNVAVGADDVAPGGEALLPQSGHGDGGGPRVAAGGGLVSGALGVGAQPAHAPGGLGGANGPQQALRRVKGAVGVVGVEGDVVRPGVADVAELPGQVLLPAGEDPAEREAEVAHALGEDAQLALEVVGAVLLVGAGVLGGQELGPGGARGQPGGEGLGDPGAQGPGEDVDGRGDARAVGRCGHVSPPGWVRG